jgi:hypothetical protein
MLRVERQHPERLHHLDRRERLHQGEHVARRPDRRRRLERGDNGRFATRRRPGIRDFGVGRRRAGESITGEFLKAESLTDYAIKYSR